MMQLKIGSKGEIVIPKKIREAIGLVRNRNIILEVENDTIKIRTLRKETDIIKKWETSAKKYNIDPKKIIYGDKLYEGVF